MCSPADMSPVERFHHTAPDMTISHNVTSTNKSIHTSSVYFTCQSDVLGSTSPHSEKVDPMFHVRMVEVLLPIIIMDNIF